MTSGTAERTTVKPTWTTEQIQASSTRVMLNQYLAMSKVFEKFGPEAATEFQTALSHLKAEHFRSVGVKTPADLVRAMAEFETNVFGSIITWWGDETKASMTYESCACWNAMQKSGCVTPETEQKMGEGFAASVHMLATEFGFKGELEMGEKSATIHFARK